MFWKFENDGSNQWHEFEDGIRKKKLWTKPCINMESNLNWNIDNDNGDGAGARGYNQDFDPGRWIGSNDVDTWIGGTSGDWTVGSNWGSGSVPTSDERVWIRQLDGSNNALELGSGSSAEIHIQFLIYLMVGNDN